MRLSKLVSKSCSEIEGDLGYKLMMRFMLLSIGDPRCNVIYDLSDAHHCTDERMDLLNDAL